MLSKADEEWLLVIFYDSKLYLRLPLLDQLHPVVVEYVICRTTASIVTWSSSGIKLPPGILSRTSSMMGVVVDIASMFEFTAHSAMGPAS